MMDYHIFYRVKPNKDTARPLAHKKEPSDSSSKPGTNLLKTPAGSQEYILETKKPDIRVQVDGHQNEQLLRSPRLGVSHQIMSPDLAHSTVC